MAAARPLGPAPTTIASIASAPPPAAAPVTSFAASPTIGELADRCGERSTCRADRGAVPDVPPVPPLALAVDADSDSLDHRRCRTRRRREISKRGLPELVVLPVPHDCVREVVERVGRPLEGLCLRDRHVAIAARRERDPRGEGVTFGGHERE